MLKKPVIGLVPMVNPEKSLCEMPWSYCNALEGAGALPMILPLLTDPDSLRQTVSLCSGILLTGGPDVDPARYGEQTLPACGTIIPQRDEMEALLFRAALEADKPVLGICRGIQAMNVALGGTLWQDLPTQVEGSLNHTQPAPYDKTWHKVSVTPGTPLADLLGVEELEVTSRHHQAVKEVAPRLKAMAFAPDGVLEAVWMPGRRFVWGVQWHPESVYQTSEASRKLFAAFVEQCR